MNIIRDREFSDQEVILDHVHFKDCEFDGCNLIYHGHGECNFTNCNIQESEFSFEGQASNTLDFLNKLSDIGLGAAVLQVIGPILGDPEFRIIRLNDEEHLVLDSGPIPGHLDEEDREKVRDKMEDNGGIWRAERIKEDD